MAQPDNYAKSFLILGDWDVIYICKDYKAYFLNDVASCSSLFLFSFKFSIVN